MEPVYLDFSTNWNNKLDCDSFTTLRLMSNKYQLNLRYTIRLKKQVKKDAHIIAIKPLKLYEINDFIAHIDTGYSRQECIDIIKKMYPNANWETQIIYLILLKSVK